MKGLFRFSAGCFAIAVLLAPCITTAGSPREALSREALNANSWALAPLGQPVPGDIRRNLTFLREDLLDEGHSAPEAGRASYKAGYELCNLLIAAIDEHDQAAVRAGYRAAQAEANTRITNQSLSAHASYQTSWPQDARIRDQRAEIQRQETNKTALARETVRVDWSNRVKVLQRGLDEAYMRYRQALRQDVNPKPSSPGPAATQPAMPGVRTPAPASTPFVAPAAPTAGSQPWSNSLGMKFVPVPGTAVQFSIWDTRVQDFEAFVQATGYDATKGMRSRDKNENRWQERGDTWKSPGFAQGPAHPVCGLSWEDAKAFCVWLTGKERQLGKLTSSQEYRLPTDLEWSTAVGLENEAGDTPKERNGKIKDVYPWGTQWPPPREVGNYYETHKFSVDDYEYTSPVGSFSVNQFGLYDMGGNVWQWCEDASVPFTKCLYKTKFSCYPAKWDAQSPHSQ